MKEKKRILFDGSVLYRICPSAAIFHNVCSALFGSMLNTTDLCDGKYEFQLFQTTFMNFNTFFQYHVREYKHSVTYANSSLQNQLLFPKQKFAFSPINFMKQKIKIFYQYNGLWSFVMNLQSEVWNIYYIDDNNLSLNFMRDILVYHGNSFRLHTLA